MCPSATGNFRLVVEVMAGMIEVVVEVMAGMIEEVVVDEMMVVLVKPAMAAVSTATKEAT